LTGTTEKTHRVIRKNIGRAPLYSGQIQAVGPRSCPSIEDKVIRFPNRETHQIYIEPEGLDTTERYLNGLSTSFPREVQGEIVATVPGLESAQITKYGYAIEYDYFPPRQLNARLEVKKIKRLYLAGQINGTTGYEEAGAQGLMAGINAALSVKGLQPRILPRSLAYIGVMIDDLVLKGVEFPYRIYTSRAESRLFLRNDNSDIRLSGIGRELGLLDKKRYQSVLKKEKEIRSLREKLKNTRWSIKTLEEVLGESGERFQKSQSLDVVLRRPGVTIGALLKKGFRDVAGVVSDSAIREVEMSVKYEGYIRRGEIETERLKRLESVIIPKGIDFLALQNLAAVSRERLNEIRPRTLGQVARIPGMSSNDVSVIAIAIEKLRRSARVTPK
jgi:tRNA uridine 5-carboxymethylaminomethyl modification enzyme